MGHHETTALSHLRSLEVLAEMDFHASHEGRLQERPKPSPVSRNMGKPMVNLWEIYGESMVHWLVVKSTPLENMSLSIGMMTFPIYRKMKFMFQSLPTSNVLTSQKTFRWCFVGDIKDLWISADSPLTYAYFTVLIVFIVYVYPRSSCRTWSG